MTMNDGSEYVSQVDHPRGSIGNPMTDEQVQKKFSDLATPVVGMDTVARITELVANLEDCDDVMRLMRLTTVGE